MTIHDTNKLPDGARIEADICIVGAGAAGITMANSLARGNARICLLESGGFGIEEDVQGLYDVENIGYPVRENFMSRVRYFGGSCNLWAGRSMRLSPIDFKKRDWVPNSGWPLDYGEIAPFYERAEEILRLPRFSDYEIPANVPGMGNQEKAVLSSKDAEPALATWATKPMRFGKFFKRGLKQSRNVDLYVNANVVELVPSEDMQSITTLTIKTMDNRTMTVSACTIILAAGGLENARLLLASRARSDTGIGNQYDQVGRYFLDHPRAIFGSIRINESVRLPYLTGIPITTGKIQYGIAMSEAYQRRHGSLNCYASLEPELSEFAEKQYGRSINVLKVLLRRGHAGSRFRLKDADMNNVRDLIYLLTPKEIMPHFVYKPYALLKQRVRRRRAHRKLSIINYCEQVPDPDSRVTLSTETDALGMNRLRVNWRLGDDVRQSVSALQTAVGQLVEAHGIGELETDQSKISQIRFSDASHHIGTTRMSGSPRNGVVDRNCRVYGTDNLYICSSSVFPTGGYANPTSTILALTLRLADHLNAKGGGG